MEQQGVTEMRLSRNFSLHELTRSQKADRLGIDNTPPPEAIEELQSLVLQILQPLRDLVGRPINVSSGYRCEALNQAINGAKNSQHMKGQAADIECFGLSNMALAKVIIDNFQYDQLILEFYDPARGPNSGWVHVSHKRVGENRQRALRPVRDESGALVYETLVF